MKYILCDEERRQNAIEHIKQLDITKPISVHIKPYKKNRTTSQNDLMWVYYEVIADFLGMTPKDLHELMKVRTLGIDEKIVDDELIRTPKSTTDLSTKEMIEFISAVDFLAVDLGLKLPLPDDRNYAMGGE